MNKRSLLEKAAAALLQAHAPYSRYKVGAALLCCDGTVITGCNVENTSFGLSNCAERTAFFSAIAQGHHIFKAIAIVADGQSLPIPCGACRQVMSEFCSPNFGVYCACAGELNSASIFTLEELLPHAFGLKNQ